MANGIIGDAYMHRRTVNNILARKAAMEQTKNQGISGKQHEKARDLGEKIVFVNSLKRDMAVQEAFAEQNKTLVKLRLGEKERVIRGIQREAERFKESLVLFNDGTEKDPASFLSGFKQHMATIEREGNTRVGDSYIFGGSITNLPPFNISQIPDGIAPNSGVTTDYYNGNGITTPIAIDSNNDLDWGLLGTHPAFEKLIRGLKIATDPSIHSGGDRITQAQNLADEAITELAGLISQIGSEQADIDQLIEAQEDKLLYMSEKYEELVSTDELEVATNFMTDSRILTLAYEMMGRLGQMSLADHWK